MGKNWVSDAFLITFLKKTSISCYSEKKIVLKCENAIQLEELQIAATGQNIPSYLVHDAGHTQVPVNSRTVLSIFGEESIVNNITGKLKLL